MLQMFMGSPFQLLYSCSLLSIRMLAAYSCCLGSLWWLKSIVKNGTSVGSTYLPRGLCWNSCLNLKVLATSAQDYIHLND